MYYLFSIIPSLVRGISFDYEEDSFREIFKNCGEITLLYMVHRNDGRYAGFGYTLKD